MYYWRPIFECELCGKRTIGVKDIFNNWMVPSRERWSGSFKKHGRCLCNECTKAFNQLKDSREK